MSYSTFNNITLQQLESIIALVRAGSFTKAAGELFISQSALTKQILNMEESAGARLIDRGGRGIVLTPEGRILYDYARKMVRMREDAKDRVERIRNREAGRIYISASSIPAAYILPRLLVRLHGARPDIHVHMEMRDSEETLQSVLNSQAEIGFLGKEVANRKLVAEPLWKDRLVLAAPVDFPLGSSATWEEISGLPFVIREQGSGTRYIIEDYLRNAGVDLSRFNIVCEMGSNEAVKEAVLAGLGVSIMSFLAVRRELEQGLLKIAEIANGGVDRHFFLIYRNNFPLGKHHIYFLDAVRNFPLEQEIPMQG